MMADTNFKNRSGRVLAGSVVLAAIFFFAILSFYLSAAAWDGKDVTHHRDS